MRYLALHFLSFLYRLAGVFGFLFTIVATAIILAIAPNESVIQLIALAVFFYGSLSCITSYAAGEFLQYLDMLDRRYVKTG